MKEPGAGSRSKRVITLLCGFVWLLAIALGAKYGNDYENTATPTDGPARRWPETSTLQRLPETSALVVALHPECPCSQATVSELREILALTLTRPKIYFLIYAPPELSHNLDANPLLQSAGTIPNAEIFLTPDAALLEPFRARVSGEVLLYDPSGILQFHGGITGGRGMRGSNLGATAVLTLLQGKTPALAHTPVFGCAIRSTPNT